MSTESPIKPFLENDGFTPLSEAEVLLCVDLDKNDNRFEEKQWAELKKAVETMASEGNAYIQKHMSLDTPIIDTYGRISPEVYPKAGNSFSSASVKVDRAYVYDREIDFMYQSAMQERFSRKNGMSKQYRAIKTNDAESISDHYYRTYGATTRDEMLDAWRKERSQGLAEGWEMYATALFHKAFGKDFLIVRASSFDDIANGIDTVIFDKKTGNIVCAFDELHDAGQTTVQIERAQKKRNFITEKNSEGGSTLKYGFKKADDKLVPASIRNVPILRLSVDTELLKHFMYTFNADAPVSEEECVFIMKLLGDLIHEAEQMERIIVAKEDEYTERRNRAVGKMEKLRAQKGWKNNPKIMQEIRELEREKNITSLPIDGSPIKNHIRAALNAFHHMYDQYDMSDKINEL
jgi:hypothetical protein